MYEVLQKVRDEVELMTVTESALGGFSDVIEIRQVVAGDPPKIQTNLYPIAIVEPNGSEPATETTGHYYRDHEIIVSVFLNAPEYFSRAQEEVLSKITLTRVMGLIDHWFMRNSNRILDGLTGVDVLSVGGTDYNVTRRSASGNVKGAQITLSVRRRYAKSQ